MTISPTDLAASLDSTNLRLDATDGDILRLCEEAVELGCAAVMIYPANVQLAANTLRGSRVRIGTVIGFPSGRFAPAAKAAEITAAKENGAHEVDIVMNYAAFREGSPAAAEELAELTALAHPLGLLVKVIVETCYLPESLLLPALVACEAVGADFIKTSTGFGSAGAQSRHVTLWAQHRKSQIQIKAAGGIKTLSDARLMLAAGATRLGTSSASAILAEARGGIRTESTSAY